MRKGLVAGDFVPPHAGHHALIDTARVQVAALTVAVRAFAGEPIRAELRARWLRDAHPDVQVVVIADPAAGAYRQDGLDSAARATWLSTFAAQPDGSPDVLFSADAADAEAARRLGCAFLALDGVREIVPVASAAIRRAPLASLELVTAAVRAYLVQRVCIVGPESTGKTTLCERLAARYAAPWVAEYGREYTLAKLQTSTSDRWEPAEFVHLAREQQRREDDTARRANGLLIADTDAFATRIWLERYLGPVGVSGWPIPDRPIDLYLLTDANVPFVADAIRDGEQYRHWMFERFQDEFTARGWPFVVLDGSYAQREARAIREIEGVLERAVIP